MLGNSNTISRSLHWTKSRFSQWINFESLYPANKLGYGVYIIWVVTPTYAHVVYVGQGDIAARLKAHQRRREILAYGRIGNLYVAWAEVPVSIRDGVERYLANRYQPYVGEAYPNCYPIAVNSPWN